MFHVAGIIPSDAQNGCLIYFCLASGRIFEVDLDRDDVTNWQGGGDSISVSTTSRIVH